MIALRKLSTASAGELRDLRGWLLTLAYHACIDLYREKKRRREECLDSLLPSSGENFPLLRTSETPESLLLSSELIRHLIFFLESLPAHLREPIKLYSLYDMDYRRISRALRLTEANVRKRIQQARRLLREQLEAYGSSAVPAALPPPGIPESTPLPPVSHEVLPAVRSFLPVKTGGGREVEIWLLREPPALSPRRISLLRGYIQRHPSGWKKRLELARALVETGCYEEALQHFRFVAEKRRDRTEVWIDLGILLLCLSRFGQAAEAFTAALSETESPSYLSLLQGLIDHCRGSRVTARALLSRAAAELPRNLTVHLLQAWAALDADEAGEAIEACQAALALEPGSAPALLLGHDALLRSGRAAEAQALLARAEAQEESPAIMRRRALHHLQKTFTFSALAPSS